MPTLTGIEAVELAGALVVVVDPSPDVGLVLVFDGRVPKEAGGDATIVGVLERTPF